MSDDTYYTVLNVPETAPLSEIKGAYRDLIRQVHPDTISNLAPYLRGIAEEKAKELTEAYSVLSSSDKRREYDEQLAAYRRQTSADTSPPPRTQQASSQSSSGPYCNTCGTSLSASGFCPKCNKFTSPAATPQQPKYNWAFLKRWSQEHPILAFAISGFFFWLIATMVQFFLRSRSPSDERWTT
jgi:curved DNA-binding protein CbpA